MFFFLFIKYIYTGDVHNKIIEEIQMETEEETIKSKESKNLKNLLVRIIYLLFSN